MSRLDQQLDYLWRVHGLDYYAGEELPVPELEARGARARLHRPPRPEEGEQASEADGVQVVCLLYIM